MSMITGGGENRNGSGLIQQRGVGIVEIMIALVLGSLLVVGVVQVYVGGRVAYQLQDEMSRLQENGRFAFHFLAAETRMAGYFGCRNDVDVINILNPGPGGSRPIAQDFSFGVQGFSFALGGTGWSPQLPDELRNLANPPLEITANGSDVLVIRRADSMRVNLRPPFRDNNASTLVRPPHNVSPGDLVLVSDCQSATLFQSTGGNPPNSTAITHNTGGSQSPGNSQRSLGYAYADGASLSRALTTSFYIARGASGQPALFRRTNSDNPEELVDGVERMRIRYGLRSGVSGQVTEYRAAPDVNDWSRVASVRISLMMSGRRDGMTENPQSFMFFDEPFTAPDNRMRQVMTTTITLRNRVM